LNVFVEEPLRVLFVERELSYEPQGIMSMSAVLRSAGHEVALTVESMEDPVAFAVGYQPDILGYSVMTGSQRAFFDLNSKIRGALNPARAAAGKGPVISAFGGPPPTFFPEMISEPGVDGICIGEGEGALLDLANALGNGGFHPAIQNWWFNVDGEIIKNPVRPADPRPVGIAPAGPGVGLRQASRAGSQRHQAFHHLQRAGEHAGE
jgi:anaerobic magnesium-protoporphyrin IX monomethyl ester cyclase